MKITAAQCRRKARSLVRLYDIDTDPGMCMEASQHLSKLLPNAKAIQGQVKHKTGTMSHWWVEWNGFLIDPTSKQLCDELDRFCAPALGVWPINTKKKSYIVENVLEYKKK